MITRRDFLKGMGAILAAPIALKLDFIEAREHAEYFGSIDGVYIESIGKKMLTDIEGKQYPALVYHLRKEAYKSIAEIDQQLINISGEPDIFIRRELERHAEHINEAERQGIKPRVRDSY